MAGMNGSPGVKNANAYLNEQIDNKWNEKWVFIACTFSGLDEFYRRL